MFLSSKKKKAEPDNSAKRRPLNLPVIPEKEVTPEMIAKYLKNGTPIWAWYNAIDKPCSDDGNWNINALMALEKGRFDGFSMYRKEEDYLCKYTIELYNGNKELYLKLSEIRQMKNSNIMDLTNNDLADAYEVYHDDYNLAAKQQAFIHDITQESVRDYLKNHRVMYVGEEHFYKKDDYLEGLSG